MRRGGLVLSILVTTLVLVSCSKEKSDETGGTLLIGDQEYELTHGVIEYSGEEGGGGHLFGIVLGSSGITFIDNSVEGKGDVLFLRVYSDNAEDVHAGTFTLDIEETAVAGTFRGHIYIGYNSVTYGISGYYLPTSGSLLIEKVGSSYTITVQYSCNKIGNEQAVLESNIPVTCTYSGELLLFE